MTATVGAAIITRDDLAHLEELLAQLAQLDQVVVVDSGSSDGAAEHVRGLGPPYELHSFKWRPRPDGHGPDGWGFAAAREESFRHLRTTHAIWLSSDDLVAALVEGNRVTATADRLATALRRLAADKPENDAWMIEYLFSADAEGNPTSARTSERFVKLEAGWRWRHPVSEFLQPERAIRSLNVLDLAVVHQWHERGPAHERNLTMLRSWLRKLESNGAAPTDVARARLLVGKGYQAQEDHLKAAEWLLSQFFGKHADLTPEARWAGWTAVATSLLAAGDSEGVRHAALEAIAARPGLPEPYVMLADAKAGAGDPPGDVLKLLDIAESCLAEPHGQLERNPMFVNYVMPVLAAESLLQLDRPQEALVRAERALRQRPADDRSRQA